MSGLQRVAIYGTGAYTPSNVLTNEDFARTLDTTDEWITSRTGIKRRRIAVAEQATSDLCLPAAQAALENAGVAAEELDLIITGTITPDYIFPSTSCVLQEKLGLASKKIPAFDLSAACSGFLYALATAEALIAVGTVKQVLVLGGEIISRIMDYTDRSTCILFGDGAGAVVMGPERTSGPSHLLLSTRMHADGSLGRTLYVPAGGSKLPTSVKTLSEKLHTVRLDGREVFRFGVIKVCEMIQDAMERHNLRAEDLGAIVPHQANIRIIEAAADRLGLPLSLFVTNIQEYGNTSAASVPIALDEANRAGRLPPGKPVVLLAFGAGMTWSSAVVQW